MLRGASSGAVSFHQPVVDRDRVRVTLELEVGAEPIVGCIQASGRQLDFSGWVGLATALAQAISSGPDGTRPPSGPELPSDGTRELLRERAGQLGAGMDSEFEIAVAQMALHGVDRDEQLLRDLPVRQPGCGQSGDAPLTGRE